MGKIEYRNKYGYLQFETIENYKNVGEITSKNYKEDLFFSIDDAEKIALITENNKIQLSCVFNNGKIENKMFLIHHLTASMGAVCKVIKLEFLEEVNAEQELEKLNKYKAMTIEQDFLCGKKLYNSCDCKELYNCCDCGGNKCECRYCWSCNACQTCLSEK